MKKILITAFVLLSSLSLYAVPARPGSFTYTQPDGTVLTLRKVGDEWGHYTIDASGRVVERGQDGFYREVDPATQSLRRLNAQRRREAARRSRSARSADHTAIGQKRFLVILVEFSDLSFTVADPQTAFSNLMNQQGYSVNGAIGSARDFYYQNSHGIFEPIFDVYGPVPLTRTYSYYGANDSSGNDVRPEQAVIDACKALDDRVDFSKYDLDDDGYVDMVFMYYAGYGEADYDGDEDIIWPHQWEIEGGTGKTVELDGVKLNSYACTNERIGSGSNQGQMCGIGTACHEFGHAMGLPDFYDTDYSTGGQCAAMYFFSIMDSGSYNEDGRIPPFFTTEERMILGWIDQDSLHPFTSSGPVTLTSVDNNFAYYSPTDKDGEYFVYEFRGSNLWDAGLPAHGMTVTHVDKSDRTITYDGTRYPASTLWSNWHETNAINAVGSHPCCYIVPAGDQNNLLYGFTYYSSYHQYFYDSQYDSKLAFPITKGNKVNSYRALSWNGVEVDAYLTDITYSTSQVQFLVTLPKEDLDYNVIANPGNGQYNAGDRFSFELVESETRPVSSVAWYFDDEPVNAASVTLTAGAHTVEARLTLFGGTEKIVTLELNVN